MLGEQLEKEEEEGNKLEKKSLDGSEYQDMCQIEIMAEI